MDKDSKFKMIVFDVDGTLTKHPSVWRFIHEELGLWHGKAIHYLSGYVGGEIGYQEFCDLDAALWKGRKVKELKGLTDKIAYSDGVREAIPKLKAVGFRLTAISTGLTFFTDRVRNELGLDEVRANELVTEKGFVTGKTIIHVDEKGKGDIFDSLLGRYGLSRKEALTVVDSRTDIPMAERAGYSIGFNCEDPDLGRVVDYNCKTRNFREVYDKILEISGGF
ncbi:MAG: HAD family phosphatase [Candidatus Omnitrophica bacterium]|nr:HAD family phosphatase [Candidatus Omnitrophota bacterium]